MVIRLRTDMKENKSSEHLTGVTPARKKDYTVYYRASITFRGKHISLGSYPTARQAHQAYREASSILSDPETVIEKHPPASTLSFEKRVCLINYRDNGIYIAHPIYIRPKMFYYYLSPDEILKFDVDDLFYYSSHKIMKRGGHLFVADYGAQVSVAGRYGIKRYAVEGRDYRFKNGDPLDFRYSNIEILNSYHGVRRYEKNNKLFFRALIHIKGNYVIGTYPTEIEAAIAYNKAVDLLHRKGVQKNYAVNFVDGVSPSEYAKIYEQTRISKRITTYIP